MVGILAEGLEDVFPARHHLVMVVRGDVGREELGLAGLVLRALHRIGHEADGLLQRREGLVALRLVVLDEVAAQPELVAGIREGFRPQPELRLDDRAHHHAAVAHIAPQHAPHVGDVHRGAVEQAQIAGRHIEIVHLGIFDVAHALVVADRQRQERAEHRPPVDDVAVEELDRIGDLHDLLLRVDLIDERIDAAGEIVGGRDLDVGAGGAFGREMRRRLQIAVARLGLHDIGAENVTAAGDQIGFLQIKPGVAVGLVHDRILSHEAFQAVLGASAPLA